MVTNGIYIAKCQCTSLRSHLIWPSSQYSWSLSPVWTSLCFPEPHILLVFFSYNTGCSQTLFWIFLIFLSSFCHWSHSILCDDDSKICISYFEISPYSRLIYPTVYSHLCFDIPVSTGIHRGWQSSCWLLKIWLMCFKNSVLDMYFANILS